MVFIFGAALLALAAGDQSQIFHVGWAIGLMLFAVLRLVTSVDDLALMGMQIAIGGLVGAAVMTWQLRVLERLQGAH